MSSFNTKQGKINVSSGSQRFSCWKCWRCHLAKWKIWIRFTELSHFRAFNIINDSQNKSVNLSSQQLFVFNSWNWPVVFSFGLVLTDVYLQFLICFATHTKPVHSQISYKSTVIVTTNNILHQLNAYGWKKSIIQVFRFSVDLSAITGDQDHGLPISNTCQTVTRSDSTCLELPRLFCNWENYFIGIGR